MRHVGHGESLGVLRLHWDADSPNRRGSKWTRCVTGLVVFAHTAAAALVGLQLQGSSVHPLH